jgi:hypothetical protein
MDLRECKICNQVKPRLTLGLFPNGRAPKYADEHGKLWNGLVCPSCTVDRAKETMKITRSNRKLAAKIEKDNEIR